MANKTKSLAIRTVEVMSPAEPDIKGALERMVERKLAEMMGDTQDGIFEPFFQTQAIAAAIRKLETVPQQRKWQYYFEDWGCLICGRKDVKHHTLGMCRACYSRIQKRLVDVLRRASDDRPKPRPARDLQDVAREALRTASGSDGEDSLLGAAGIPALEVETRPQLTSAERTAQREKIKKATRDRITAWRAKRARRIETLHQAKALRFEEGLTWKEVTQRLDPTGFANDSQRATERLRIAVHKYFPPEVRKAGQATLAQQRQERTSQRKAIWRHAKVLHDEQNLTWREIAQRLDPDFDKNPKAAIARIEQGAHRVSLVRDLTDLAHAALRRSR